MAGLPGIRMTNTGNSSIITLNLLNGYSPYLSPTPAWALGIICTVSSGGSLNYTIQITADPIPSSSGNWNNHDTLTSQTASANGNVAFPITGIRAVVNTYVSGSVNLGVCQWP